MKALARTRIPAAARSLLHDRDRDAPPIVGSLAVRLGRVLSHHSQRSANEWIGDVARARPPAVGCTLQGGCDHQGQRIGARVGAMVAPWRE
jgi:hypothetical protein